MEYKEKVKLVNRCLSYMRECNIAELFRIAKFCKLSISNIGDFKNLRKRIEDYINNCVKEDLVRLAEFLKVKIPNSLKWRR